jgi:hypothetical protein
LPLQITMLRRYAPTLQWPIYFATEVPNDPIAQQLQTNLGIKILPLPASHAGFLESRALAISQLPPTIQYILPLQEDFLLDRAPDYAMLKDALFILDTDRHVSSLRLNPCPGPHETDMKYSAEKEWIILGPKNIYLFTYQATLWRRWDLQAYLNALLASIQKDFGKKSSDDYKYLALTSNIGENHYGQALLKKTLPDTLHLSCPRKGKWSNAVYLCPWPYRPTAVVRGMLEPFAKELFEREGVKFEHPEGNTML